MNETVIAENVKTGCEISSITRKSSKDVTYFKRV